MTKRETLIRKLDDVIDLWDDAVNAIIKTETLRELATALTTKTEGDQAIRNWFYQVASGLDVADAPEAGIFEEWYQELADPTATARVILDAHNYLRNNPDMQVELERLLLDALMPTATPPRKY